ncbi:11656_t:CDS:2, partial [Scutellospora calospora]
VRDIKKLGYTYPELEKLKGLDLKGIRNYILELYKPDDLYRDRFFVKVTIESGKIIGTFIVRVFVNLPTANSETPANSPHFAGFIAMWQGSGSGHNHNNTLVHGTVDITAAMERLNISTQTHHFAQEVNFAQTNFAQANITTGTAIFNNNTDIKLVPVMIDGTEITPKAAGVKLVEIFSFEHDKRSGVHKKHKNDLEGNNKNLLVLTSTILSGSLISSASISPA